MNPADNGRPLLVTGPDSADGNSVMALDTNAGRLVSRERRRGRRYWRLRYQIDNPAVCAGLRPSPETTDNTMDIHPTNDGR